MSLCNAQERKGELPHVFTAGSYDGAPIQVCIFCGAREDGELWHRGEARRLMGFVRDGYRSCPYSINLGEHRTVVIGCGGYGTVAANFPTATRAWLIGAGWSSIKVESREPWEVETGSGSYLCQTCRGTGMIRV